MCFVYGKNNVLQISSLLYTEHVPFQYFSLVPIYYELNNVFIQLLNTAQTWPSCQTEMCVSVRISNFYVCVSAYVKHVFVEKNIPSVDRDIVKNRFFDPTEKTINFRNNLISDIAEGAFQSQNKLKSLTLSNNKMTRIPSKALSTAKLLKEIFLDYNSIQVIRQKAFERNENLEWLHLAHNNISTISGDAFAGLQKLKFLNLEGNAIKAIGARVLAHLSGCVILDLSKNLIKKLHSESLEPLASLNQLKLDSNLLTELEDGLFNRLGKLEGSRSIYYIIVIHDHGHA